MNSTATQEDIMHATARQPLTTTTWADLGPYGLTRETAPRSWEALCDLAYEAAEATADYCSLSIEDWRVLVDAAASGLPVVLEHVHSVGGRVERTTRTYVIEHVRLAPGVYDNVRARTWGFTSTISLPCLQRAAATEATYEYPEA